MVVTVFAAALIGPVSGLAGAPRPPLNAAVATAKTNLLSCVAPLARGTASTPKDREVVEAKIDALLAAVKEVAGDTGGSSMDFAVCPEISGTWQLEYTTEAELLVLMKNPKTVVDIAVDRYLKKGFSYTLTALLRENPSAPPVTEAVFNKRIVTTNKKQPVPPLFLMCLFRQSDAVKNLLHLGADGAELRRRSVLLQT